MFNCSKSLSAHELRMDAIIQLHNEYFQLSGAITLPNISFSYRPLANTQGVVSSIYLFVLLINFHTVDNATEKLQIFHAFSITFHCF